MKKAIALTTLIVSSLIVSVLIGLVLLPVQAATNTSQAMSTAERLYEAGQYGLAAQTFRQLVDQGYADSTLFYNLGNAYFQRGDVGRAIASYRRAEELAPRDVVIETSLKLARAAVGQPVPPAPATGLLNQFTQATQQLTLNELALIALGTWLLFCGLWLVASYRQASAWRVALTLTGLTLVLSLAGLGSRLYVDRQSEAVVVTQINAGNSPGAHAEATLPLKAGAEVVVQEIQENWVQVALPDGGSGWLPIEAVELLNRG